MDWKRRFLEQSVLGQGINLNDSEQVIMACISKAYKDMNTSGRFYIDVKEKTTECRQTEFFNLLKKNDYKFTRQLIKDASEIFGSNQKILGNKENTYATRFGLAQKLVNMTYKYLYIFSEHTNLDIDFSSCDCPLDSIVLGRLPKTQNVWSKMEFEEYEAVQKKIEKRLIGETNIPEGIGNLAFDFKVWGASNNGKEE